MSDFSIVYVWHCPHCEAKGQTTIQPPSNQILCLLCQADYLIIESMIPLFLFE